MEKKREKEGKRKKKSETNLGLLKRHSPTLERISNHESAGTDGDGAGKDDDAADDDGEVGDDDGEVGDDRDEDV